MTHTEAVSWIKNKITSGYVDPRSHIHTCREIIDYFRNNLPDKSLVEPALVEAIDSISLPTLEQLDNVAYLAVNLRSVEGLRLLVERSGEIGDAGKGIAVAALRSFPDRRYIQSNYLQILLEWLENPTIAVNVFETISDIIPELTSAFLSILTHYHSVRINILHNALTHVYYRNGDTETGRRVIENTINGIERLSQAIESHPILPQDLVGSMLQSAQSESHIPAPVTDVTEPSFHDSTLISDEDIRKSFEAQSIISQTGNTWGVGGRLANP